MQTKRTGNTLQWLIPLTATIIAFFGISVEPSWANDSGIQAVGGAVTFIDEENTTVVMRSARIDIDLATCSVECNYVFENTGEAADVSMGFPEKGIGDASLPEGSNTNFLEFRSWVDGEEVDVTPIRGAESSAYNQFWVKTVHFSAGQTREVRNTFIGDKGSDVNSLSFFIYEVAPAATWRGRVDTIEVNVDLSGMEYCKPVSFEPSGYDMDGELITWRWRNVEPSEDIYVSWFEYYGDIWVDGKRVNMHSPGVGEWVVSAVNPYPRIYEGSLQARCEHIAGWLGLECSYNDVAYTMTLTDRRNTLIVPQSEGVPQLNGRDYPFDESWLLTQGWRQVSIRPVAEAFGAHVLYDPVSMRTYIHTADAIADMDQSDFTDRRLSLADLRNLSADELRTMCNEIYARNGRVFQDPEFRHYFYCQPWYQPDPHYSDSMLTDLDRANINLIVAAEESE